MIDWSKFERYSCTHSFAPVRYSPNASELAALTVPVATCWNRHVPDGDAPEKYCSYWGLPLQVMKGYPNFAEGFMPF